MLYVEGDGDVCTITRGSCRDRGDRSVGSSFLRPKEWWSSGRLESGEKGVVGRVNDLCLEEDPLEYGEPKDI